MRWLLALALLIAGVSTSQAQGSCAPPRLTIGGEGQVTPGAANRMRDTPSRAGQVIGEIPSGARFDVLDGPVCDCDILWWQVGYNGITGYTAEASGSSYFVDPVTAAPAATDTPMTATQVTANCPFPPTLRVGGLAYVNDSTPVRMRDQPSTQGREIRLIQNDQNMRVLEGPVCDGTYIWWRVTYKEATGWTVEGSTSGPFLTGIDPTATPTQTLPPIPTFTPTATATPLPSVGEARDVEWSADGETLYLLGSERLAAFDVTDLSAFGVDIMANPQALYQAMERDRSTDDAFYMMTADAIDYVTSDGDTTHLITSESLAKLTVSDDGALYSVVDTRESERVRRLQVFDRDTEAPLYVHDFRITSYVPGAVAISPDGTIFTISPFGDVGEASYDSILIFPVTDGEETGYVPATEAAYAVQQLAFAHDSSYVVSASIRGDIERFTPDGTRASAFIRAENAEDVRITRLIVSPDDQLVAIIEYADLPNRSVRGVVRVYRARTMSEVFAYGGQPGQPFITDIAFSPDSSMLAAAGDNGVVLFDMTRFAQIGRLFRVED